MGSATDELVAANSGGTSGTANPPPTTVEGAFMRFFGEQDNKHGRAVSRNVLAFRAVKNTLAAFEGKFQGTEIIRRLLASKDRDIILALGLSTDVSYHFPDMLPVFASYSAADRRELGANIEAILKLHTIEDGGSYKKGALPGSGGMTETDQIRLMDNARKSFEGNLRRLEKTSGSEDPRVIERQLLLLQKQIAEINNQGPEARDEHKTRLANLERQETLLKSQIAEIEAEREAKRLEKEQQQKLSQAMREKINELLPKLWAAINNYDPTKPESRDSIDAEMAAIFSGILEVGDFSDPDEMMKVLQPLQALLEQKETRHKEAAQTKKEEEEEEAKSLARGEAMEQLGNMFSYQSRYGSDAPPEAKGDVRASAFEDLKPFPQPEVSVSENNATGGGNAFSSPRAASRGIYEILNNKGVDPMARNNGMGGAEDDIRADEPGNQWLEEAVKGALNETVTWPGPYPETQWALVDSLKNAIAMDASEQQGGPIANWQRRNRARWAGEAGEGTSAYKEIAAEPGNVALAEAGRNITPKEDLENLKAFLARLWNKLSPEDPKISFPPNLESSQYPRTQAQMAKIDRDRRPPRGRLSGGGGDPYHKSMELDLDGSNNNDIEEDEVLVEDISLMPPHPIDCGFVPPMPRGPSPAVIINVGANGGSR